MAKVKAQKKINLLNVLIYGGLIIATILFLFGVKQIIDSRYSKDEIKIPVCYRPVECFENYEKFAEQFPRKEVPKYYPECLIYCAKNHGLPLIKYGGKSYGNNKTWTD